MKVELEPNTLCLDAGTEVNCQVAERKATMILRRRFQTGSLFKRGKRKKVWVARWWEPVLQPDGTLGRIRKAEVLGPVAELPRRKAQILLSQRLQSVNSETYRPKSQLTFKQFVLEEFEPNMLPAAKYSTQKNYRHLVRRHLFPVFGEKQLCNIRRVEVQRFLIEKLRAGYSWQTTTHLKNTLSKTFGVAQSWSYVEDNPARAIKLPPKQLKYPRTFLSPEQARLLLNALPEPARTITLLALLSGMRIGEILALRWKNVDLLNGIILVRETVYEGHFSTPKTASSRRDIPIPEPVQSALTAHRTVTAPCSPESLVFRTRQGSPLCSRNLRRRALAPAGERAGIPSVSWHAFRHTHATYLAETGASIKTAQAQLGHSSLQTTLEVYTHAIPNAQREAVGRLANLLTDPNGLTSENLPNEGLGKVQ